MRNARRNSIAGLVVLLIAFSLALAVHAQGSVTVLAGAELTRVVPTGFYFEGLSAQTQMRNSAAARFGSKRYVVAGLVDTSGYAADVRGKYEGFLITDSPITINGAKLATGAWGFGFGDGKLHILDLGGNEVLSVATTRDGELKRPRPLMMTAAGDAVRLYTGRDYVLIRAN